MCDLPMANRDGCLNRPAPLPLARCMVNRWKGRREARRKKPGIHRPCRQGSPGVHRIGGWILRLSVVLLGLHGLALALGFAYARAAGSTCRFIDRGAPIPEAPDRAGRAALVVSARHGLDRLLAHYPVRRVHAAVLARALGRPVDTWLDADGDTLHRVLAAGYHDVVVHGHGDWRSIVLDRDRITEAELRRWVRERDLPPLPGLFLRHSCGRVDPVTGRRFPPPPPLGTCLVAHPSRTRGWNRITWYLPDFFLLPLAHAPSPVATHAPCKYRPPISTIQ